MRTRALFGLGFAGLLALALLTRRTRGEEFPEKEAYSVQLHLHGSFSEGIGSIDSHTAEALRAGVDVLWWSDHDWRIEGYRVCSRFGFEGFSEPLDRRESWTAISPAEAEALKGIQRSSNGRLTGVRAEIDTERRVEGTGSLLIEATADDPEFQELRFRLFAQRLRFIRPLASGVTLALAVFPDELGPDAHVFVEVQLSLHPDPTVGPRKPFRIRYELSPVEGIRTREGDLYRVPVALVPGEWNRIELPLTLDAGQGFPGFDARDNAVREVFLGVASRRGAMSRAHLDDLELRELVPAEERLELERSMLVAETTATPRVRQLLGTEISYVTEHMNQFTLVPELFDYEALIRSCATLDERGLMTNREEVARRTAEAIVGAVHHRGGLVSYNHVFGVEVDRLASTPTREQALATLLANDLFGADILEVGYRQRGGSLDEYLWVWDRLGLAGRFAIGTGVSDSHVGYPGEYAEARNNFVSWIWARSMRAADLLAGLRRGRVYFGDISRWDGRLDLRTTRGFRMGDVVVTRAMRAEVEAVVDPVSPGDVVTWVVSGEIVGAASVSGEVYREKRTIELHPAASTLVRIEVRSAQGDEKAFSNPITFVREEPDHAFGRVVRD